MARRRRLHVPSHNRWIAARAARPPWGQGRGVGPAVLLGWLSGL
jgi:hypothetical protein